MQALKAILGEHAPQKNVVGVALIGWGGEIIHILKSSLKVAFKVAKSEWNSKILSRDYEGPSFKRMI